MKRNGYVCDQCGAYGDDRYGGRVPVNTPLTPDGWFSLERPGSNVEGAYRPFLSAHVCSQDCLVLYACGLARG